MLKKNKLRFGVATTAALAAAALAISAMPAYADPSAFKTLSGVGSDTIQDVLNGLGSQISAIGSHLRLNEPSTGFWGATTPIEKTSLKFHSWRS